MPFQSRADIISQIMRRALEDIGFVQTATEKIRELLIPAYVTAFHSVNGKHIQSSEMYCADEVIVFSIVCSLLALCVAVCSRGGKIEREKH